MLRHATVTIHNTPFSFIETLSRDERFTYIIAQEELGDETKRIHIQAYFQFKNPLKWSTLQNLLPYGSHIEKPKGSPEENRHYCSKPVKDCRCKHCIKPGGRAPGGSSLESGEIRVQGARTDLIKFKRAIDEGKKEAEIIADEEMFGVWARHPNLFKRYKCAKIVPRRRESPPDVSFYHGATGVGKTRRVFDEHKEDVYIKDSSKWWDGYEGQRCILLDEINPHDHWKIDELLRFLDRYPYQGQTKGGYVNINSPFIVLTSNKSLEELYPEISSEQMSALERRIINKVEL